MKKTNNSKFQKGCRKLIVVFFLFSIFPVMAKAPLLTVKELSAPPAKIIRTCCSFGANIGISGVPFVKKTDITSLEEIGNHHFLGNIEENNGNIYTKRGGFIDLGHLRDCADWTAYLYQVIIASKENGEFEIIHLGNEGGSKKLLLEIPEDMDETEAGELAGKIAYDLSLWHEIATWYGTSYVPLVPERYSSFSPEDLYSNLLGIHLGMQAIQSDLEYNEAMSLLIAQMFDNLEAVSSRNETYDAMVKVDEIWYTSQKRLPNKKLLLKRYLDNDSYLTPWLVPKMGSRKSPFVLSKPESYLTDFYELNIKLNFRFPVKSIFPDEKNRVITQKDFSLFLAQIQSELTELEIVRENNLKKVVKRKEKKRIRKLKQKEKLAFNFTNIKAKKKYPAKNGIV